MSLSSENEQMFSIRLLSVDSYLCTPLPGLDVCFSDFKKSKVRRIPVVRVFGSTPAGQTACMHIHGVLPYLMVPYHGPTCSLSQSVEAEQYLYQVGLSIDQALNSAAGVSNSKQEHVFKIVLLRGKPFYGYNEKESLFLKIYFYLPHDIKKAADLLQAGAIMSRSFQPHEAHVPFILQFFLDYNLHGMNLLHSKSCWFRKPLGKPSPLEIPLVKSISQPSSNKTPADNSNKQENIDLPCLSQLKDFQWNKLLHKKRIFDNSFDNDASLDFNNRSTKQQPYGEHRTQTTDNWKNIISHRLARFNSTENTPKSSPLNTMWSESNVPTDAYLPSDFAKRQSTCDIEIDILAADILNRNEMENNSGKNPGLEAIWEDERLRRRARGDKDPVEVKLSQDPRPLPRITDRESRFLTEMNVALSDFYIDNPPHFSSATLHDDSVNFTTPRKLSSDLFFTSDGGSLYPPTPVVDDEIVSQVVSTPSSQRTCRRSSQKSVADGNVESDSQFLRVLEELEGSEQRQLNSSSLESQHSNGPLDQSEDEIFSDDDSDGLNIHMNDEIKSHVNARETLEMTQPWESGIEDLIFATNHRGNDGLADDQSDTDIPQLDGASDEIQQDDKKHNSTSVNHNPSNVNIHDSALDLSTPSPQTFDNLKKLTPTKHDIETMQSFDHLPGVKAFLKQRKHLENLKAKKSTSVPPMGKTASKKSKTKSLMRQISLPNHGRSNPVEFNKLNDNVFPALLNDRSIHYQPSGILQRMQFSENKATINLSLTGQNSDLTSKNCGENIPTVIPFTNFGIVDNALIPFSGGNTDLQLNFKSDGNTGNLLDLPKSGRECLRPRSSRQISKNKYNSDHFYETTTEDWSDFIFPDTLPTISNVADQIFRPRKRKTVHRRKRGGVMKPREKKSKKEKVFIKWIIVHRFKGTRKMKIKLWQITDQPRVKMTSDLEELYSSYSPILKNTLADIAPDPNPPKPLPKHELAIRVQMGKRTKGNRITPSCSQGINIDSMSGNTSSLKLGNTTSDAHVNNFNILGQTDTISKFENVQKPSQVSADMTYVELTNVSVTEKSETTVLQPLDVTSHLHEDDSICSVKLSKPDMLNKFDTTGPGRKNDFVDIQIDLAAGTKKKVEKVPSLEKTAKINETRDIKSKLVKPPKKSTILPVSNRTLTPINQVVLSESSVKSPVSVASHSIAKDNFDQNYFQSVPFSPMINDTVEIQKTLVPTSQFCFVSTTPTIKLSSADETSCSEIKTFIPQTDGKSELFSNKVSEDEPYQCDQNVLNTSQDPIEKVNANDHFDKNLSGQNNKNTQNLDLPDKNGSPSFMIPIISTTVSNSQSFSSIQSDLPTVVSPTQPFQVSPVIPTKSKPPKNVLPKRYQPTKRVTRHSVTVRMRQLITPQWMHDAHSDNSGDISLLRNVLETLGYSSPVSSPTHKSPPTPPRPWSPMLATPPPVELVKTDNIVPTFAEEDDVGVLDIDTESMLKEMGCIGDIMQAANDGMKQHGHQDDLLSHLDALLEGEDMAAGDEAEAVEVGSNKDIETFDNTIKEMSQNSAGFMDILMDSEQSQKFMEVKIDDSTNIDSTVKNLPDVPKPQKDATIPSKKFNISAHQIDSNSIKDTLSSQWPNLPQISDNSGVAMFLPPGQNQGLSNKQTLEIQLHKQMQAVILQQQMLDNNIFRTSTSYVPSKPPSQTPKVKESAKENMPAADLKKDLLGEICQQVFSDNLDNSATPVPLQTLNSGRASNTFSFGLNLTESKGGKSPTKLPQSPPFHVNNNAPNTFLYPCKTSPIHTERHKVKTQPPVITHPAPNPLQVLHTHVHHHHHIHSIKPSIASSLASQLSNQSNPAEKCEAKTSKIEPSSNTGWPTPKRELSIPTQPPLVIKPKEGSTQTFDYCFSDTVVSTNTEAITDTEPAPVEKETLAEKPSEYKLPEWSILRKPTCQNGDERYWLQIQMQNGIPWKQPFKTSKKAAKSASNLSKKSDNKSKPKESKLSRPKASLVEKIEKPVFSTKKKTKTGKSPHFHRPKMLTQISKRAPSNTPTISLSGINTKTSRDNSFDLSQDMFQSDSFPYSSNKSPKKEPRSDSNTKSEAMPCSWVSEKLEQENDLPHTNEPQFLHRSPEKEKGIARQAITAKETVIPLVKNNQELILNYVTGKWEIMDKKAKKSSKKGDRREKSFPARVSPKTINIKDLNLSSLKTVITRQQSLSSNDSTSPSLHSTTTSGSNFLLSDFEDNSTNASSTDIGRQEYVVSSVDSDLSKIKLILKKNSQSSGEEIVFSDTKPIAANSQKGKPSCFKAFMKRKSSSDRSGQKKSKKARVRNTFVLDSHSGENVFIPITDFIQNYGKRMDAEIQTQLNVVNSLDSNFGYWEYMESVRRHFKFPVREYAFPAKTDFNIVSSSAAEYAVSALDRTGLLKMNEFDENNNNPHETSEQQSDGLGADGSGQKPKETSLKRSNSPSSKNQKIPHREENSDRPFKLQKTGFSPPLDEKQSSSPSLTLKAVPGPPSLAEVREFMISSNLVKEESGDPFYGDPKDVQSTSRLFTMLPSYVKKTRHLDTTQQLKEFDSSLTCCNTIQHWRVVMAAEQLGSTVENATISDRANQIAQEMKLKIKDEFSSALDVVLQLPEHPMLSKSLVDSKSTMVLQPTALPPTHKETRDWLKTKKRNLHRPKSNVEKVFENPENYPKKTFEPKSQQNSQTPILKRVDALLRDSAVTPAHRPRKVSFDLAVIKSSKSPDSERVLNQPHSITLSPSAFPPNQVSAHQQSSESSSMTFDESEDFISMRFSTSSSFSFDMSGNAGNSKSLGTSGSAIASLVDGGHKSKEDTSLMSLLSGQFKEDSGKKEEVTEKNLVHEDEILKMKSTPSPPPCLESTPVAHKTKAPPLRKLLYTPISSQTPDKIGESFYDSVIPATPPDSETPRRRKRSTRRSSRMQTKENLIKSFADSPLLTELSSLQTTPRLSGIAGPSLNNTYGFRALQQDLGDAKALHEKQHVTVLSMELHVKTRLDLCPDPELDEIRALFYALEADDCVGRLTGSIIVDAKSSGDGEEASTSAGKRRRDTLHRSGITILDVVYVANELELFQEFADLIHHCDPDILLGYEVQMLSWGYLFSRATHLSLDLCRAVSRFPADEVNNRHSAERDAYGADNASEIHVVGRIVLNLWRLMRTELAIYDYKFESVAYHLLHERHPHYSFKTLTAWFDQPFTRNNLGSSGDRMRHRAVDYYMCRVVGNVRLILQQDLVGRTSELARLFGIQFYEVLTRGSQFRVEGMMLRLAHSLNYIAVSPGVIQRAGQKAPECIALVMEPESRFYSEPVIVVDFQSLYPSVVIGHNYCFSTCLGRVQHLGKESNFTFGCTNIEVPQKLLHKLLKRNQITVAPNGVAYVKSSVRRGILPTMLDEILNTRVMVKSSMKKCDDSATKRMLDHRQLGLKLIANVTYGYTAANYSGRMPCVEIADSIVHKARETLERAITLVNNNKHKWKGRVVYGDTDSMFIALEEGTSKERAFQVGREIVKAVTDDNERPMKLKFEKVYKPCILQTKKRYVGYAYETEDQQEPIFDAKGIETVRRDGCPAVSKVLEKSLKILFESRDVSKVKSYVEQQCTTLLDGRSTLQDCTIAKEYRGALYYKPGAVIPALVLTRKMLAIDRRSEPRLGERVPYVVVHGAPGMPLFRLVRHPQEVLNDPRLRIHGTYYVTKMVLPALDRMMSLLGVDVFQWYRDLPRSQRLAAYYGDEEKDEEEKLAVTTLDSKKMTISQYFDSKHCLSCDQMSQRTICHECVANPSKLQYTLATLMHEARILERRKDHLDQICASCTAASRPLDIQCDSLDCPVLYKRIRVNHEVTKANFIRNAIGDLNVLEKHSV